MKVDKHHKIALPWSEGKPDLPLNREMAKKRLTGLKKRLRADPELCSKYSEKITDMLEHGYAVRLPVDAPIVPGRTWYIPHHCTSILSMFRVVFDCSAKFNGVSLNDQLLQGPDFTNSLVGVLLRFRQEAFAVVADIKSMFFQILVEEGDRDVFRFLWFPDNDFDREPVDYQMQVHLFGATSSPSVAAYALRRTAWENSVNVDAETVRAVLKNFYVDDLCKSCASVEQAINFIKQISDLLSSGGFHLTKFLSNPKQILSSVSENDRASSVVDLQDRQLPTQKALGVYWNADTDNLEVKVNIREKPCTRRGLMSMIAQTYDPLGLLQPFMLPAKRILLEACRLGLAWDTPLMADKGGGDSWLEWLQALPSLEAVSLARSFKMLDKEVDSIELHVFSDASVIGYGACAYLRVLYVNGFVGCSLVMRKSRVAPLKPISVPRLELTAAVPNLVV